MSRNFLRKCSLSLSGSSDLTINGGGNTDLRIVFSVDQWTAQSPNMAHFRIYNAGTATVAKLQAKEFTQVQFSAGYEDNVGVIFKGEVKQFISGHENAVDSYVDLFAADSERSYNTATVNRALAAGYTPQDKAQTAIDAMTPFGVSLGLVNVDLSQPRYPRGLPIFSMARDVLREVALSKGALWSTQMGKIHIIDHTQPIPGDTVTMSGATGMIGWPKQTPDGIVVTSLINPKLQPHVNLKIDPSLIQQAERDNNPSSESALVTNQFLQQQNATAGLYNIFKLSRHGDTRGADWFDESWCIGAGGNLPPSQLNQKYYLGQN